MGRLLLQLLLNSLIFISATAYFCRKNDLSNRYRLPDYVIPEHYNIKLEPYFETEEKSFNFSGRCEVNIKIISPTWCISLHAQKPQIEIQNTTLIYAKSLNYYQPTNITYNNETHILTFHFDYELSTGYYWFNMSFIGLSDNDGYFFRTPYINFRINKTWFVATQFPVIGARQLFPCWDEPALKATFNISVKHPIQYLALSSRPTQNETVSENMSWTYFQTTPLMSTYLVTLALHDIYSEGLHNGDARYESLLLPETIFARNVTTRVLWRFNFQLGDTNDPSYYVRHLITLEGPRHNGMGLILYKVSNVFYNETLDPVSQKMKAACLIAYEVARQWINSQISPSWWSDYWLNEGIARLTGMRIINEIFLHSSLLDLFVVQSKQECLYLDHFMWGIMNPLILKVNTSSEIDSLFSFSYYIKAPVILHMLQQFLSDYVFKQGIEIFLDKHKFSSATIDDFWNAMQAAQDVQKTPNIEKFNVKEMMNTWTKQKHYPVLKISNNRYYLITFIENVNHMSKDDWFIPITMTTITPTKQIYTWRSKLKTHMNHLANQAIELDVSYYQDDLIIVNFLGYYRVNYELENWLKIARYLNSADYKKIYVLDRAQIIDDAFYFLSKHHLNINTFLELTKYLSQETDYVAWYPMIKALERMSSFFPILDEKFNLIKKNMQEILNNVLEKIGYEETSEGDCSIKDNYPIKCLRQEVAKWACTLEHPKCLAMAKYKLEQHVVEYKKLLPWWREWTYCKGIMTEKNLTGIWKTIFQNWISNPNEESRIFEFLTCIAHPNSIKMYLNDVNLEATASLTSISLKIRYENRLYRIRVNRFLFTIIKHAKNDEILEHILNNFKELRPREINTVAVLIIIINHVYSESQLEKIQRFVFNNIRQEIDKILKYTHTLIEDTFLQKEFDKAVHECMKTSSIYYRIIQSKIEIRIKEIMLLRHRIKEIVTFE